MLPDSVKAVCSVTEMAKKVGLSRIRFYQLRKEGVFPEPVCLGCPKRLFYTLDLQQKCIEIRKTGIGYNSKPVIFNAARTKKYKKPKRVKNQPDNRYEQLADILRQWRRNVSHTDVKNAVNTIYPEGLARHTDEGMVLRDLVDYFNKGTLKCSIETIK